MKKKLTLTTDEGSQILPITINSSVGEIFADSHFDDHLRVVLEKARAQAVKDKNRYLYKTTQIFSHEELKEEYYNIVNRQSDLPSAMRYWILSFMTTAGESVITYYKNKKV